MESNDRPMYMLAELEVSDPTTLQRYADAVKPLLDAYGASIIATSPGRADVLEGGRPAALQVIQKWPSRAAFDTFLDVEGIRRDQRAASCVVCFAHRGLRCLTI